VFTVPHARRAQAAFMPVFSLPHFPRCLAGVLAAVCIAPPALAAETLSTNTFTFYSGRISSEETWHDVLRKPYSSEYADAYLVSGAFSHAYGRKLGGKLRTEYEINVTYNFGAQDHWELNVAPITLRWMQFPWNERVSTTVAFGLGLSYAFDYPMVEYELENDTRQLLLFWQLELTAGPPHGKWSTVLRLHHRSPGWGAMGVADGGMNAPSLGFRYEF
jgi:hypothetical protein